MTPADDEPVELTKTEARAGSKTKSNRNVMFVSIAIVVIAFGALLLIYR